MYFSDGVGFSAGGLEIDPGEEFADEAGGGEDETYDKQYCGQARQGSVGDGNRDIVGEFIVEYISEEEHRGGEAIEGAFTEEMEGFGNIAEDEAERHKIEYDAEGAGNSVIALSVGAVDIGYGNFGDSGAVGGGEGGDETMHFAVEPDAVDDLSSVSLESGSEIVNADAAYCSGEAVGDTGGDFSPEEVVDAVFSPAADDVISFIEFSEEDWYFFRGVLEVAIHCNEDVGFSGVEACGEGRCLAEVAAELDNGYLFVFEGQRFELFESIVAAAIIDEDELVTEGGGVHNGSEPVVKLFDDVGLIVERYDNRTFGLVIIVHSVPILFQLLRNRILSAGRKALRVRPVAGRGGAFLRGRVLQGMRGASLSR